MMRRSFQRRRFGARGFRRPKPNWQWMGSNWTGITVQSVASVAELLVPGNFQGRAGATRVEDVPIGQHTIFRMVGSMSFDYVTSLSPPVVTVGWYFVKLLYDETDTVVNGQFVDPLSTDPDLFQKPQIFNMHRRSIGAVNTNSPQPYVVDIDIRRRVLLKDNEGIGVVFQYDGNAESDFMAWHGFFRFLTRIGQR